MIEKMIQVNMNMKMKIRTNELDMIGYSVAGLKDGWFFSVIERDIDEFEVAMWREQNTSIVKKTRLIQDIDLEEVINKLVDAVAEPSRIYEGLPKGGE